MEAGDRHARRPALHPFRPRIRAGPGVDFEQAEKALYEIIRLVARMRALALADPDHRFTLSGLIDGASDVDGLTLERDATVTAHDLRFKAALQVTYGVGLDDLAATLADLSPAEDTERLQRKVSQVEEFFAGEHGRPLAPRVAQFMRLIVQYLDRAGAEEGPIRQRVIRRHVAAAFWLMARSDFCAVRDKLLTDEEREDIDLLLLSRPDQEIADLMRALGHAPAERVFREPYEDKDNNLNEGPTKADWLRSIVYGRDEGEFKKDLLSPPPGFPRTAATWTWTSAWAPSASTRRTSSSSSRCAARYRGRSVPLNGAMVPALALEFSKAMGANPALSQGATAAQPWPEAIEQLNKLEAWLGQVPTVTSGLRRAAANATPRARRLLARTLAGLQKEMDAFLAEEAHALPDVMAPLREVSEGLWRLNTTWLTSGDVFAVLPEVEAATAAYEAALWEAGNRLGGM